MQEFVHSVFITVATIAATLLTVGLTGVLILLATDGGSSHTGDGRSARPAPDAGRAVASATPAESRLAISV